MYQHFCDTAHGESNPTPCSTNAHQDTRHTDEPTSPVRGKESFTTFLICNTEATDHMHSSYSKSLFLVATTAVSNSDHDYSRHPDPNPSYPLKEEKKP